ncbi:MAG: thiamine pyrophosphate-dependent dehydrogenase E1 component subunit alpha [Janthinobacterium lividum]
MSTTTTSTTGLSEVDLIEMQRRMLRIRKFDERASKMVKRGQIPGTVHTSIGQEAQVVGTCMALGPRDQMTGNHRSHGHPIGKGAPLGPLMAELVGKATGVCKGKGGSLHLADFAVGSLGESGIVGSSIPIATGAALSAKVLGEDRVALAFFGDGAANQGNLYEAMNLAGVWRLPVVFLCENNQYALSTPAHTVTSGVIADRAAGFGIPGVRVEDGQHVLQVHAAVSEAVERARSGGGPTLVEVMTYRFNEHSEGLRLGVDYRDAAERDHYLQLDPIVLFAAELVERGVADAAALDALAHEVDAEVEDAFAFSQSSPFPDASVAFEDLYTDPADNAAAAAAAAALVGPDRFGPVADLDQTGIPA